MSGQRLSKGVIVDLDDSTAGDGNGKFGGFNRVRSFDVRRIAVAVIFVDDGNIVCASRDSTLADNIVFTVTAHIFGGILGVGNAVTAQMQALAVQAGMEFSGAGSIDDPVMPRPVFGSIVLSERHINLKGSAVRAFDIYGALLFVIGQLDCTAGRNREEGIIQKNVGSRIVTPVRSKLKLKYFARLFWENKLSPGGKFLFGDVSKANIKDTICMLKFTVSVSDIDLTVF